MAYDEELILHKSPIHFADYLLLPEAQRVSDNIYFIDDISSDSELIERLIEKIEELKQLLIEADIITE